MAVRMNKNKQPMTGLLVYLDPEDRKTLEKLCKAKKTNKSEVVRQSIRLLHAQKCA
jgi:guanylate kinase